jgi:DNA-binding NarL/FixJ family response regulator
VPTKNAPTRLTIAHDNALVREMLELACSQRNVEIVGCPRRFVDLVGRCQQVPLPDVALASDWLGGQPVEEVLKELLATGVSLIVLSADPSPDRLSRLLSADIAGYLSYDASPDEIVLGVLAAARGEIAVNPSVASVVLGQWRRLRAQPLTFGARRPPSLTRRELDILNAMADGLAAKAIALRLGVALKTVENHKIRIFDKLGVRSHAHAVTVALAYGLAPAREECR